MNVTHSDLYRIKQRTLAAIVRGEQRGEAAARKENNRKMRNRLRCYIHDNRLPDPTGPFHEILRLTSRRLPTTL